MKKRTESEPETTHINSREFFTVGQLSELLHLNPMTIYRIVKSGELASYQIGRIMRFRRDDVEDFLTRTRMATRKVNRH